MKKMKKIFILIIFTLTTLTTNAQLFEGGIDAGITASQIDGDQRGGYNKIGISIKFYSLLNISKTLSLTSGVGFATKGARNSPKTSYFSTSLHYAEIPLIVNIKPYDKLSFSGGLNYGYLIYGIGKTASGDYREEELNLRKSDLSTYFSLNYSLTKKTTVKFAYNYSLMPVTKFQNTTSRVFRNVFLYYLLTNRPSMGTWWNNSIRVTFQYKIIWSGKQ